MDKMGEHTATPERAIALQKLGGPLADTHEIRSTEQAQKRLWEMKPS